MSNKEPIYNPIQLFTTCFNLLYYGFIDGNIYRESNCSLYLWPHFSSFLLYNLGGKQFP